MALPFSSVGQTFTAIKEPECLTQVSGLFTTGTQYNDNYPANGVIPNSYSFLTRWQGTTAPTGYALGDYTGVYPPIPSSPFQNGPEPQYSDDPLPGNQLYCWEGAMVLNTRAVRHHRIVGGGYNNMFGYAWAPEYMPLAFSDGQDLVVQINAAFTHLARYENLANTEFRRRPILHVGLFAYLRDNSSNLPHIAVVGVIGGTNDEYIHPTSLGAIYSDNYVTRGGVNFDYAPSGVWFASSSIRSSTPFTTTNYVPQPAVELTSDIHSPGSGLSFYRMHISPKNLVNIVREINSYPCTPGSNCPFRGYSENPNDYRVAYAGLIAEADLTESAGFDDPPPPGQLRNRDDQDQIEAAIHFGALGIYASSPNSSFKTGTVTLTNGYYTNILHRTAPVYAPDPSGRDWWAGTILSQTSQPDAVQKAREMGSAFFKGLEYDGLQRSDSQFVEDLYRGLLWREPDAGGHAYWTSQVAVQGRDNVMFTFLYSGEYYATTVSVLY